MTLAQVQALVPFVTSGALYGCIVVRRKRYWHRDVCLIPFVFIAASELPASLQLCLYGFFPDAPGASRLEHAEIYVSGGGLVLLGCSLYAVAELFKKVLRRRKGKTSAAPAKSADPRDPRDPSPPSV